MFSPIILMSIMLITPVGGSECSSEQITVSNIHVNNSLQIGDRVHVFTPVYNYNLPNNYFFEMNPRKNNEMIVKACLPIGLKDRLPLGYGEVDCGSATKAITILVNATTNDQIRFNVTLFAEELTSTDAIRNVTELDIARGCQYIRECYLEQDINPTAFWITAGTTIIQTHLNEIDFGYTYKLRAECLDYSGFGRLTVHIKRKLEVTIINRSSNVIIASTEHSSPVSNDSDLSTQSSLAWTSQSATFTQPYISNSVTPPSDLHTTLSEPTPLETTHQRETLSSTYSTNSVIPTSDIRTTLSTHRCHYTTPGTVFTPYFSNSIGPTSDKRTTLLTLRNLQTTSETVTITPPDESISMESTTDERSTLATQRSLDSTSKKVIFTSYIVSPASFVSSKSLEPTNDAGLTLSTLTNLETTSETGKFTSDYYSNSIKSTDYEGPTLSTQRRPSTTSERVTITPPYYQNSMEPTTNEGPILSTQRSIDTATETVAITLHTYSNSMLPVTDSETTPLPHINIETTSLRETSTKATPQSVSQSNGSILTTDRKSSFLSNAEQHTTAGWTSYKVSHNASAANNGTPSTINEMTQAVEADTITVPGFAMSMTEAHSTTTEIKQSNHVTIKTQGPSGTLTNSLATSTVTNVKIITDMGNDRQSYFAEPMNAVILSMLGLIIAFVVISVARSFYSRCMHQDHNLA